MAKKTRTKARAVVDDDFIVIDSKAPRTTAPVVETPSIAEDPYYKRDPKTGLSPAQVEAQNAAKEVAASMQALGQPAVFEPGPKGFAGRVSTPPTEGLKPGYQWYAAPKAGGGTEWRQIPTRETLLGAYGTLLTPPGGATDGSVPGISTGDTTTPPTTTGGATTNLDVLKSVLRGMGFNYSIIDSSSSFLLSLLKDGLDYDNAVEVFLNSKEYTLKDGKKMSSPFYAEYSYLNEGLVKPKSASELYNAVEGYKEVSSLYNLNTKFTSKEYLQGYVKNNVSVAKFAENANLARLKGINSDPAYIESLRKLGYITGGADLTDFYLDPKIGEETLIQRRSVAALGSEAIKRAKQGIQFSTERFNKLASGLLGLGLGVEQIEAKAAQGFQNIAEELLPFAKVSGIYEGGTPASVESLQAELEMEEFTGLESERRKRLKQLETRSFQAQTGAAGSRSLGGPRAAGII